jgi:hypothetical protein
MKKLLGTALLFVTMMLAVGGTASAQISLGIRIGAPPPARAEHAQPRRPGPDYTWIGGYWYPVSGKYKWHAGYWTRPPYAGATWVAPHHDGQEYHAGYWNGDHGQTPHDHASDRSKMRDERR